MNLEMSTPSFSEDFFLFPPQNLSDIGKLTGDKICYVDVDMGELRNAEACTDYRKIEDVVLCRGNQVITEWPEGKGAVSGKVEKSTLEDMS